MSIFTATKLPYPTLIRLIARRQTTDRVHVRRVNFARDQVLLPPFPASADAL